MSVRAKFKVDSYETSLASGYQTENEEVRSIKMSAVYGDGAPENKEFFKWTPFGQIQLGTLNKKAWEQFELGKEYYVDFTLAE